MGWDGSGTYTRNNGTFTGATIWNSEANDGTATISSSNHDTHDQDLAAAIHACLTKNGENAATGNLDLGGYLFQSSGAPSDDDDLAVHGDVIASGAYSSGDDEIQLTLNDGTRIDVDVSGLSAGTGGLALTGNQTASGIKTWSGIGVHSGAKFSGETMSIVDVPTPGASVTVDTTAANDHYVTVGTNTNVTFTWPSAASDTQLGANWCIKGEITFRVTSAGKTITLNSTMLAALDVYGEEGAAATGLDDLSTLVYNYKYINGTKICQFAWVATP